MYNKVPFKRGVAIREDRGTFLKILQSIKERKRRAQHSVGCLVIKPKLCILDVVISVPVPGSSIQFSASTAVPQPVHTYSVLGIILLVQSCCVL